MQTQDRVALMMMIKIAHERYMTIAHRSPVDIIIDPISFAFVEPGKTQEAAEFLREHGYTVRLNNRRCHVMELSPDHYQDEEKEKENHITPESISEHAEAVV